jgi:hypothetical protein
MDGPAHFVESEQLLATAKGMLDDATKDDPADPTGPAADEISAMAALTQVVAAMAVAHATLALAAATVTNGSGEHMSHDERGRWQVAVR